MLDLLHGLRRRFVVVVAKKLLTFLTNRGLLFFWSGPRTFVLLLFLEFFFCSLGFPSSSPKIPLVFFRKAFHCNLSQE